MNPEDEYYNRETVWLERQLEETLEHALPKGGQWSNNHIAARERIWDIVNKFRQLEREKPWQGCL